MTLNSLKERKINTDLLSAALFSPKIIENSSAWIGHLPFAAWVIQEAQPKVFVELGTHYGHSYFAFCEAIGQSQLEAKCFAVDTWLGDEHSGKYAGTVYANVQAHNDEHYADFSTLLHMTFDDAVREFADKSIDLLHIDGLHTYDAVRHDFDTWLPKVKDGGIIMLHDICVHERNFGVWKLWEEIKAQYKTHIEFPHSFGLGVVQIDRNSDPTESALFPLDQEERVAIVMYFEALGMRQMERYELRALRKRVAMETECATNLEEELVRIKKEVRRLKGSISWRMTGPIRALGKCLERFTA